MEQTTEILEINQNFLINQIEAADDVYGAFKEIHNIEDPSLLALRETDIYRLRRGLCLPSAMATCINWLLKKPLIGSRRDEYLLTIGDFFRFVVPFHNRKQLTNEVGEIFDKPWFVVNESGDVYHQAILAFAKGLGIEAFSLINFPDIESILSLIQQGLPIAISLDNRFVIEKTLGLNPDFVEKREDGYYIKIEGQNGIEFRKFEPGRHVVSVLGLDSSGNLIIHDSFILPQMKGTNLLSLSLKEVDHYLRYQQGGPTRAIVFSKEQITSPYINPNVFIPKEVVKAVETELQTVFSYA